LFGKTTYIWEILIEVVEEGMVEIEAVGAVLAVIEVVAEEIQEDLALEEKIEVLLL
jgi:hypothetical protein